MVKHDNDLSKATAEFRRQLPRAVKKPRRFVERWTAIYRERGIHKPHRPRRPKKLSDEQALKAAKLFAKGYKQLGSGLTLHFTSMRQATSKNPELQKICTEAGVSPRQLFDRMRQAMPTLKKRSMTFIQPLGQKLKEDRVRVCKRLLRQNRNYFDRMIWIDAAKFWVSLDKHQSVWVNVEWDNKLITEDRRAPGKRGQKICLAYYAIIFSVYLHSI